MLSSIAKGIWRKSLRPILTISWGFEGGIGGFISRRATQVALLLALLVGVLVAVAAGVLLLFVLLAAWLVIATVTLLLTGVVAAWRAISKSRPPRPFESAEDGTLPALPPFAGGFDPVRTFGPGNPDRLFDGVFEGGGIKAIAQVGALHMVESLGMRPERLVGTSGGAIVAAGIAVGGTSSDLWRVMARADLTSLLDARWLPNVRTWRHPLYGITPLVLPLFTKFGLMRGDEFINFLRQGISSIEGPFRGNEHVAFGDINREWRKSLDDRALVQPGEGVHRLSVIATDATRRRILVLPNDIVDYCQESGGLCEGCKSGNDPCLTPATLEVALAVRMSMSIPFLFEPVRLRLKVKDGSGQVTDGGECLIVDGGVGSNFPMWLLNRGKGLPPRYPTFGFLLDEGIDLDGNKEISDHKQIRSLGSLIVAIIFSGMGMIDRIPSDHDRRRTICLPTLSVGTADFGLPLEKQVALHDAGATAAARFFSGNDPFDWDRYVKDFRNGQSRPLRPASGSVASSV